MRVNLHINKYMETRSNVFAVTVVIRNAVRFVRWTHFLN